LVTEPTLLLADTDGITYSADPAGPYVQGQTVTVTATLDPAGVGWPDELPDGWEQSSDTEASLTVTFAEASCTAVSPADPTVTEASCADGAVTPASIELATTPGLIYRAEPQGPYDPTVETGVVVTATVVDGFAWAGSDAAPSGFVQPLVVAPQGAPPPAELPEGWTWVSPTEATFAVTLAPAPSCPAPDTTDSTVPTTETTTTTTESTSATTQSTAATTEPSQVTARPTQSTASTSVSEPTTTLIPPPPGITFTFTNDPSVEVAEVGDTIDYTYCGENTSDVELEVVRVVDDKFGVLEVPDEQTIVEPGETLCSTDLGLPVSYVATEADAGTTIVNNAVVTVRTVGAEPQAFQAADLAEVEIVGPEQAEPTTTLPVTALATTGASALPAQLFAGALAIASGWLLVLIGRRRNAN
jgi:hypothetical protein